MDTLNTMIQSAVHWTGADIRYALMGLLGFVLHILVELKGSKVEQKTLGEYFSAYKLDLVMGVICYWVLVWFWHDGEVFGLLSYIGLKVDTLPLNVLTFFVAYFSSSIMTAVLSLFTLLGDKLSKIFQKKIDKLGDE